VVHLLNLCDVAKYLDVYMVWTQLYAYKRSKLLKLYSLAINPLQQTGALAVGTNKAGWQGRHCDKGGGSDEWTCPL